VRSIPVESADLPGALARALDGGPPVTPLPADPVERAAALDMLRPEEPVSEPDAAAIVVTSGSTGQPKGVVLSRSAIRASAEATHRRLGGPGDWMLALPSHYVAGFMVHARALTAGTAVHAVGSDLSGVTAALAEPEGGVRRDRRTYLSIVATQLTRALADARLTAALAGLDAVLLGGGPAPAALLRQARAAGIRVITTYGMSETCGGCVYDGVPLDGVGVELDDRGAITLSGPVVFSGYRGEPELTRAVLDGSRLTTSDRGRIANGRLEVLGRLDDVVITGGLNVDLGAVERAARPWADNRGGAVAVLGLPDPEWGTAVVAVTDADDPDDLRIALSSILPAHAVPRRVVRRSPLPRTAGGKIDRHRLRTELGAVGSDPNHDDPDRADPEGVR
jgi:O-succinylbenzoic acid--CoA ligase